MKTRIAPTPSGYLHIGNVFSFLITWLIARQNKGSVLLRIDDIDSQRMREEYLDDIFLTLDWLDIDYDEGASGVSDFLQNYSQSLREDRYNSVLNGLIDERALFGCECTRKTIKQQSSDGQHPVMCQKMNTSLYKENVAWRLKTPSNVVSFKDLNLGDVEVSLQEQMRDFIVRRKDKLIAYQLASVVDDIDFGIDYIVRGEDLITSTAAQVYLAEKLPFEHSYRDATFYHHELILDEESQKKLSKSEGATSIRSMRKHTSPKNIYQFFADKMNWKKNGIETIEDLLDVSYQQFPSHLEV